MIDLSLGSKMRENLNKEFQQKKHDKFCQWYFNKYSSKELKKIKNKYYTYLVKTKDYMSFFNSFIKFYIIHTNNEILVLKKSWKTTQGELFSHIFLLNKQYVCLFKFTNG